MLLLQPMPKQYELEDGSTKTFVLSRFPYTQGREIAVCYVSSGLPAVGDYARNQEMMLKLMAFVGVENDNGTVQPLVTQALVNNHIESIELGMLLEKDMLEYNLRFFRDGRCRNLVQDIVQKLPQWISKTLTQCLQQLSETEKPR